MARAVRKVGTTDIATISKHYKGRTFGFASRNFYVEFLAALEVDRNAERYFGPLQLDRPRPVETIALDHFYAPKSIERAFGIDRAKLHYAKDDVIVMHPGPVNRGVELSHELTDDRPSVILDQVRNGVAIRMAVLYLFAGRKSQLGRGESD